MPTDRLTPKTLRVKRTLLDASLGWSGAFAVAFVSRHHAASYDRNDCIMVGWMNAVLRALGFFRGLERLVTRVTGILPRPRESDPARAADGPSANGPARTRRGATRRLRRETGRDGAPRGDEDPTRIGARGDRGYGDVPGLVGTAARAPPVLHPRPCEDLLLERQRAARALNKGFAGWLSESRAAVVGVQEVRAAAEDLELSGLGGWSTHFVAAERPGYSGVGLFARTAPDDVDTTLGEARFDAEGRFQLARFGALSIVHAYFPNGSGKNRDNSRIPYKLDFYRAVFDKLAPRVRAGEPVLVMGDFNTAHCEIDLARPKANEKTSGFRPEERAELDRWLRAGFVDTFRQFEPGPHHYSWWSLRCGVREKNVGWRIDYVLASRGAMPFVKRAFLEPHVQGSDHCPVGVEVDDAVVAAKGKRLTKTRGS